MIRSLQRSLLFFILKINIFDASIEKSRNIFNASIEKSRKRNILVVMSSESPNPFKKIGDDWKKGFEKLQENMKQGFEKMQKDFDSFTDKVNPFKKPGQESDQADSASAEPPPIKKDVYGVESSLVEQPQHKNPAVTGTVWDSFVKNTQSTLEKWQHDWAELNKQNLEKMKSNSQAFQAKIKENNEKAKNFFENQQRQFTHTLQEMDQKIKGKDAENKAESQKNLEEMTEGWNRFMSGQKKSYNRFMRFSNRLWWKGYLNFLLWMIFMIAVIIAVIYVLNFFGITPNEL